MKIRRAKNWYTISNTDLSVIYLEPLAKFICKALDPK